MHVSDDVLVAGGNGFVAGWCIAELLENGYTVRASIRDPRKADAVRTAVSRIVDPGDRLRFVTADLLSDSGRNAAGAGCEYVLHVASPLIATRDEEQVIRPAVDGVKGVLRASRTLVCGVWCTRPLVVRSITAIHSEAVPLTSRIGPTCKLRIQE